MEERERKKRERGSEKEAGSHRKKQPPKSPDAKKFRPRKNIAADSAEPSSDLLFL
jgi:hypothetical protein